MKKKKSHILKNSFFEKGGFSRNVLFIFFIVFLLILQIAVSFKSEDTIIRIRKVDKDLFDETYNAFPFSRLFGVKFLNKIPKKL